MFNLNEQLFFFLNGGAGTYSILDGFFLFVTHFFVPTLAVMTLLWFFYVLPKRASTKQEQHSFYKKGFLFFIMLGVVYVVVHSIKVLVAFPRPQEYLSGVQILSTFGSNDSFPSAHTAFAFSIACFIYQFSKPTGVLMLLLALLVGLSRIFIGVHYPLDVLVGACIGIFISWSTVSLYQHSFQKDQGVAGTDKRS